MVGTECDLAANMLMSHCSIIGEAYAAGVADYVLEQSFILAASNLVGLGKSELLALFSFAQFHCLNHIKNFTEVQYLL